MKADKCDTILHQAIESENLEWVKEAVEQGANVTVRKEKNIFAQREAGVMQEAMMHGNMMTIQYLMEQGSDPDYMDDAKISLLMYTVGTPRGGVTSSNLANPDFTQLLIDYGADVNKKGINGYSAFDCLFKNEVIEKSSKVKSTTFDWYGMGQTAHR